MRKIFALPNHTKFTKAPFKQADQKNWEQIMVACSNTVNNLFLNECPTGMSLEKFKTEILTEGNKIPSICLEIVQQSFDQIKDYARVFARLNDIDTTDFNEDELAILGAIFSPLTKIKQGELAPTTNKYHGATDSEIWNRIIDAVGVETSSILRLLDLETADVKLIVKTVYQFLIENAGLSGTAIMIADIGLRISQSNTNSNMLNNILLSQAV